MIGQILLVSLPIGNMADITERAKDTLARESVFYAEDTRVFKELLDQLGIRYSEKNIDSFHDHSKGKIPKIEEYLKNGSNVVIVSDAGSPVISDPAYPVLKWARENGVSVDTIPGVSSVIVAIELSLFPTIPFSFWGFLPRTNSEKKSSFAEVFKNPGTHVFFESPHRVLETLKLLSLDFPNVEVAVMRELTKKFQSVYRFRASDFKEEDIMVKGEFVLVIHVEKDENKKLALIDDATRVMINEYLNGKKSTKGLSKIFSKITGENVSDIYKKLSNEQD